jgi:hypothetical protein
MSHTSHQPRGIRLLGWRWFLAGAAVLLLLLVAGLTGVPRAQATACTNLLLDGGFESGAGWSAQAGGEYSLFSDYLAHSGSRAAYLAGVDEARDRLSAAVTLPAGQTISLRFWWQVHSEESSNGYDGMSVVVADMAGNPLKVLFSLSDANLTDTWQQTAGLDLSEFAGQSIQLQFLAQSDQTLPTDFFVDDVELNACTAQTDSSWIFLPTINR